MKKISLGLLLACLPLLGLSCSIVTKKQQDGGVFRSTDNGETWEQVVNAGKNEKGKDINISSVNIERLVYDPGTDGGLFATTENSGVLVTADRGALWQATGLGSGTVTDLAADPQTPTIVYAARGREILKSIDGGDTWRTVYTEASVAQARRSAPEILAKDIEVDWYTPSRVYAGVTDGTLLVSEDFGTTWSILAEFPSAIRTIFMNPNDSRTMFVTLSDSGMFRSRDSGESWSDLGETLKDFKQANMVQWLDYSRSESQTVYIATNYGLLRSDSMGDSWTPVQTLIEFGTLPIYRVAVNPQKASELFCTVGQKLYRTDDRGVTWFSVETLPTTRRIEAIVYDPGNADILYVGLRKIEE